MSNNAGSAITSSRYIKCIVAIGYLSLKCLKEEYCWQILEQLILQQSLLLEDYLYLYKINQIVLLFSFLIGFKPILLTQSVSV